MTHIIKVAAVDDHMLFREGIRALLYRMQGIELVFEASNGKELITKLENTQPDIVLLDLEMPEMDGVEALQYLRPLYPDLGVIILTNYSDPRMIAYLLELGANAYLLKDTNPITLEGAIVSVYRNGSYFDRNMSAAALTENEIEIQPVLSHSLALSSREIEVLALICQESTAKELVDEHHLDHETVEQHRRLLVNKFKAHLEGTKPEGS